MSRFLIILLGLVALAILAFFCVNKHTPAIEDDLVNRTQQALSQEGLGFAQVGIDGREVLLTGVAPDEAKREKAEELARGVWGVRTVDNQIALAATPEHVSIAEPEPVVEPAEVQSEPEPIPYYEVKEPQPLDTKPAATFPAAPNPYTTEITLEDGKIILTGYVADEASRLWLVSKAKAIYGDDSVVDNLKVAYGAPEGWHAAVETALTNLGILEAGKAVLGDSSLSITGTASWKRYVDMVKTNIQNAIGDNYQASFDIKYNEPEPVPVYEVKGPQPLNSPPAMKMPDSAPRLEPDANITCQQKFNQLLSEKRIQFDTNQAVIRAESYPVLEQLVKTAKECPDATIEVAGHTDSRGSVAYNQRLSEARAQAVVNYLHSHGVKNTLKAVGYGEQKPIADNSTREGMAENRRIEFNVQGN